MTEAGPRGGGGELGVSRETIYVSGARERVTTFDLCDVSGACDVIAMGEGRCVAGVAREDVERRTGPT